MRGDAGKQSCSGGKRHKTDGGCHGSVLEECKVVVLSRSGPKRVNQSASIGLRWSIVGASNSIDIENSTIMALAALKAACGIASPLSKCSCTVFCSRDKLRTASTMFM